MSTTLSCGHRFEDEPPTKQIMMGSYECDPVEGYQPVVVHSAVCPDCYNEWREDGHFLPSEYAADSYLSRQSDSDSELVIVTGGRRGVSKQFVFESLTEYDEKIGTIRELAHGDAQGVDRDAAAWAKANGVVRRKFPAQWNKFQKAAGIIRNRKMLKTVKPDLVLAFPGGTGTQNMVEIAERGGYKVIKFVVPK
jgi:predicted Rossmann-fold nucleotide-binding protein